MRNKILVIVLFMVLAGTGEICAQAPRVTSFSPASGPVGTQVNINGSGFSAIADSNAVYFGATRATVKTAGTSQLAVIVPAGATLKPLSVINKITGLSGTSTLAFSTSFSSPVDGVDPKVRFLPGIAALDVQIMDIDGDGKTDILATNATLRTLTVLRNKSKTGKIDTGSFAAPVIYKTGTQPGFAAVTDFDGDGRPDVILMNIGYDSIRNGNNSLTLFHNASTPGKIKLSAVLVTDSSATAPAEYNFRLLSGDHVVRVTDIDGDGRPDIAVLNTAGFVSVYRNRYVAGRPLKDTFDPPVTIKVGINSTGFAIGDVDNDGKADMVITNYVGSSATVLRNTNTAGTIAASSFQHLDIPLGYRPLSVSLADIDGDNKLDAIISRDGGNTGIIHNTSVPGRFNGTNISLPNLHVASNYNDDIVIQDVNGDAKPDLLSLNDDLNSVLLFVNKSVPGQTTPAYFNSEVNCPVITIPDCVGDLDGDGLPDMVIGSIFGLDIYRGKSSAVPKIVQQPAITPVIGGDMVIYPNPATVSANVQYTLPQRADALISVYNNYGQLLQSFKTGEKEAGTYVNAIETSGLKMGIYVITIAAGNYNRAGKLIIK